MCKRLRYLIYGYTQTATANFKALVNHVGGRVNDNCHHSRQIRRFLYVVATETTEKPKRKTTTEATIQKMNTEPPPQIKVRVNLKKKEPVRVEGTDSKFPKQVEQTSSKFPAPVQKLIAKQIPTISNLQGWPKAMYRPTRL